MLVKRISLLIVFLFLLVGCLPSSLIPQPPQTPKEKSDFFMNYYLAQKADYETRLAMATEMKDGKLEWLSSTTEIEKDILKAKYMFLDEAEEPITLYDSYASQGQLPPTELEASINALMQRLKDYLSKQQGG